MTHRKAVIFIAALAVFVAALLHFERRRENVAETAAARPNQGLYQCPMHRQIIRDHPGHCPICGMELRKMEKTPETSAVPDRAVVSISPQRLQEIGTTFGEVQFRALTRIIRAPGRVAYDPKLYEAIEEYRQALEALKSFGKGARASNANWAKSMEKAAAFKLRLLGLTPSQTKSLSQNPALAQGLLIGKRGEAVWIYADVYEYDLPFVRPGMAMTIKSQALPGREWDAKVLSIDPVISPVTRTARARARLDDAMGLLKPGSYVDVSIASPLGSRLSVPDGAILDNGERQYAFVAHEDGTLEPREVGVGTRAGGYDEILSGLSPGETVVTSANFLIDAESQFQSAIESFAHPSKTSKSGASPSSMGSMPGMNM